MQSFKARLKARVSSRRTSAQVPVGKPSMTRSDDFWKWLRGDWGKPNLLTRAGIPRIATNLSTYLLFPVVCYLLAERYMGTQRDKEALRQCVHNPFFLAAYAIFYISLVTDWFLRDRYGPDRRAGQRFQFFRNNWKDTFVKIHSFSLAISMILFLIGGLYFRQQLT